MGKNGLIAAQSILTIILRDLIKSFNLGQTMDDEQLADLANDIIDQYYFLKIEDFRFCFNRAKNGFYDKGIYRLDASVVLSWLKKYTDDRISSADEKSYNEHQSTKGETNIPYFEKYYDKFKKW